MNISNVSDASATQGPLEGDFERPHYSRPSKTQIKNSLERFRKFTVELVELPQGRFNQLELPEEIKEALTTARNLTSLGARRRQMSFVARLVEDLDIEAIRETIRNLDHGRAPKPTSETVAMTEAEMTAEKLLDADDQTVFALSSCLGPADRQALRLFLRKTKKALQGGGERTKLRKDLAGYLATLPAMGS
jgi:ribosome-associated protein